MADIEECIIEEVKQYKCLYDKEDSRYKNILYKEKIWEEIAGKLQIDVGSIKKKWKNLRDMSNRCRRSGVLVPGSAAPTRKRVWKHKSAMNFIHETQHLRSTIGNMSPVDGSLTPPKFLPKYSPFFKIDPPQLSPSALAVPRPEPSPPAQTVSPPESPLPLQASPLLVPLHLVQSPLSSPVLSESLPPPSPQGTTNECLCKRKKPDNNDLALSQLIKAAQNSLATFTKNLTERSERKQEPIKTYFAALAQELVDAKLPPLVERSVFEECRLIVHKAIDNLNN